ncbi:MAG: glycosyltransferase family 2 protein [Pseudomonadota bacterium]
MNTKKISVITASFNQGKYLKENIKSVLNQNYQNFEHIIIDGDSKDETIEILKKYDHLNWISEKDTGQAEAINKGFKMASGDIIAWLNSDDYYEPGTFTKIAKLIDCEKDRHVAMGDCNLVDEKGKFMRVFDNRELGFYDLLHYWVSHSVPSQPSVFFCRHIIHEFGYLDEKLTYALDYEFFLRIAQKYRFFHYKEVFANYRFHAESKSVTGGFFDKFWKEWELVSKKYRKKASFKIRLRLFVSKIVYLLGITNYKLLVKVFGESKIEKTKNIFLKVLRKV